MSQVQVATGVNTEHCHGILKKVSHASVVRDGSRTFYTCHGMAQVLFVSR